MFIRIRQLTNQEELLVPNFLGDAPETLVPDIFILKVKNFSPQKHLLLLGVFVVVLLTGLNWNTLKDIVTKWLDVFNMSGLGVLVPQTKTVKFNNFD